MTLNRTLKGSSRQKYPSISLKMRRPSSKVCIVISPVLPSSAIVEINPGSPKQWSPCRWLMKMCPSRAYLSDILRNCNCAPSPQSIMNRLSRMLSTWHEGKCRRDAVAEPQPNMLSSNFVGMMFYRLYLFGTNIAKVESKAKKRACTFFCFAEAYSIFIPKRSLDLGL